MSIRKQIEALTSKRNDHLDTMEALHQKAGAEQRVFTPEEQAAWERDDEAAATCNRQLDGLRDHETRMAARARPIEMPGHSLAMPERSGSKPFKGQAFTRLVGALAISKGNIMQACELAQRWEHEMPEVATVLRAAARLGSTTDPFWLGRAAVAPGTTTDPTWAAPLINYQAMTNEFVELLRPATIVGRLTAVQMVPFNVKIPRQTAGATANWVGEGLSKPVSKLAFDSITVPWAKIAVICVISQELARFSTPAAEMLVRNDLVASIAGFIDQQFIDPAVTASAGLRPGSITNGVTPIPSSGGTVGAVMGDLNLALLALMTATQGNIATAAWIMSPAAALYLSTLRTAQDVFAFPGMSLGGTPGSLGPTPTLLGIPVIVSGNVTVTGGKSSIILVEQSEILLADDGQVLIDTSTEASLQMDSAPATPPTPLISLWQQNMLGIKAERYIYWALRRPGVVQVITGFPGP